MENKINSCLMLAIGLYTPVDLTGIFSSEDLKDTGIELDSHITLLYAKGITIPKEELMNDIATILGDDFGPFEKSIKTDNFKDVLNFFELSSFENDSDYIILKLRKDTDIYDRLRSINKGLRSKYNVKSEYNDYTPHITLAELKPGLASKYLASKNLKLVLEDTKIDFEDFLISYGTSEDVTDRKQHFLTQYKNVDRYFRIRDLEKSSKENIED